MLIDTFPQEDRGLVTAREREGYYQFKKNGPFYRLRSFLWGGAGDADQAKFNEHRFDGRNRPDAFVMVGLDSLWSGTFSPYYSELPVIHRNLYGAPVSSELIDEDYAVDGSGARRREVFNLAATGANTRHLWRAQFGDILYGRYKIRSYSADVTRNGDGGAFSGNATAHANDILGHNQEVPGQIAQAAKFRVVAAAVTGALGLTYRLPDSDTSHTVSMVIGDTAVQTKAKFEAFGDDVTVNVVGTIATGTGEVHTLTLSDVTGNGTIYSDIAVTPGMTASALQTAIRAKAGNYANVTVASSLTQTPIGSTDVTADYASATTPAIFGTGATGANLSPTTTTTVDLGESNTLTSYKIQPLYEGAGPYSWTFQTSPDGTTWTTRDTQTAQDGDSWSPGGVFAGQNSPGITREFTLSAPIDARYIRWQWNGASNAGGGHPSGDDSVLYLRRVQAIASTYSYSGTYTVTFPSGAGDVTNIESAPGTGYSGSTTPANGASGVVTIEFAAPLAAVTMTKTSGVAGYSVTETVSGSDGKGPRFIVDSPPVESKNVLIYMADSFEALDAIDPDDDDAREIMLGVLGHTFSSGDNANAVWTENRSVAPSNWTSTGEEITFGVTVWKGPSSEALRVLQDGCTTGKQYFRIAYKCGDWQWWQDGVYSRNTPQGKGADNELPTRTTDFVLVDHTISSYRVTIIGPASDYFIP